MSRRVESSTSLRIVFLSALVCLLMASTRTAALPQLINFQGKLTDAVGNPVADGSHTVNFSIFNVPSGGAFLWSEATSQTTAGGLFTHLLGSVTPLPLSLFVNNDSLFLEIVADGQTISPRTRLASVAYALRVGTVDGASGGNLSGDLTVSGNVGIGAAPGFQTKLDVQTSGNNSFIPIKGIQGVAENTSSGPAEGGYFSVGPSGTGAHYGVYGQALGSASSSYGVYGEGPTGVYGTGGTYGVYARSTGTAAVFGDIGGNFGTYGGYFQGDVKVERNLVVNGTTSSSAGVYASSSSGAGVVASGSTNGVEATGGTRGVYAGGGTYGVVGFATSNVFPSYGVYGSDNGTPVTTYAGFFSGQVKITSLLEVVGFIFKDGGGFKIDHPTDPANKYLYHSFVESPDMTNLYNGNITLDAKGEATVQLPDWFEALNGDFRYQLTAIGAPGPNLYIAREVSGNQFKIAGGTPGMKVSWQVTGIRQDAYAKAHRIPVEEEKPAAERGKYRHPKEQGMPETLGMNYEETQKMEVERKQQEEQRAKMEQERLLMEQKTKANGNK